MGDIYTDTRGFLDEKKLQITPAAEDYALRIASKIHLTRDDIGKDDIGYLQSFFILSGAEICATRNLDTRVEVEGFIEPVQITQKDMQVMALTSLCTCIPEPECSMPKNNLVYTANFAGEVGRLRKILGSERVSQLAEKDNEELFEEIREDFEPYSDVLNDLAGWIKIKIDIWIQLAELINDNSTFAEKELDLPT